ncbi:hypothetical protein PCANC_22930 [Puccinia coronata f. sp. avenae]|uniref:Uncharacterized protein n=1 Tax=Puccinia coronata f. sp. avenae TaxID=200324 RepID=A0A2N5S7S2_9BASI|nr:hypothetical protein PCASD_24573 [Puccinia coronata f. sp. avenae]PLW35872.1 hypothetical protein PCANC_22930 [Puccinia coronata f. sp. avenae]
MSGVPAVIQPVSALLAVLTTPIHPVLFPVPLLPLLHAFRISIVYRHLNTQAGGNTSVAADLAGFLLMAWGGSIVSHMLLSLPIPQLLTFTPMMVYAGTHMSVRVLGWMPSVATMDSVFPVVDGLLRTSAIAAGVDACRQHPTAAVSQSLSIQLFVGAVASSGGTIAAQTLSVWEPVWRLSRPLFLQQDSILASTDVWSGSLIAALYGYLTASHPLYLTLYPQSASTKSSSPLLSSLDAKAAASLLLTSIYCWRVYNVHYSSRKSIKSIRDTTSEKFKSKNE